MTSRLELSVCYHMIIDFLERRGLDYIPATTGLYVFTRLLPTGYDRVSESQLSEILKASGILVGTGQQYHAPNAARGWFRLVFSLGTGRLRPALVRLGSVLDSVLDNSCSTWIGEVIPRGRQDTLLSARTGVFSPRSWQSPVSSDLYIRQLMRSMRTCFSINVRSSQRLLVPAFT